MKKQISTTLWRLLTTAVITSSVSAADYQFTSPNGKISIKIQITDKILYSVTHNSIPLLSPSPI